MGRRNRAKILYNGCYAHVFSRATEKKYIFENEDAFEVFKTFLSQSKRNFSYRIHHYCLMHTHFHLVVSLDNTDQFSKGMKWLKTCYARYFNLKHLRFGPLWRDRFKSLVIEDEQYMQACGKYVENNPVEAGMVARAEDWPHSSSRYYACGRKDELVDAYAYDGQPLVLLKNPIEFFTKGNSIGSDLFQLHCQEEFKQ